MQQQRRKYRLTIDPYFLTFRGNDFLRLISRALYLLCLRLHLTRESKQLKAFSNVRWLRISLMRFNPASTPSRTLGKRGFAGA